MPCFIVLRGNMARPKKTGLDYFPHDTDAVNDEKIQALMALHGTEGYAFYFIVLERIFQSENGRITIGKPAEKAGLAKTIGVSVKKLDAILNTAIEVNCFCPNVFHSENALTSKGIKKRLEIVNNLREKERKRKENNKDKYKDKYKAKHGKPTENLRKTQISKPEANLTEQENKQKHLDFVHLTEKQYSDLVIKFGKTGADARIQHLNDYGHQKPKKFKEYGSHYHTILTWERKNNAHLPSKDDEPENNAIKLKKLREDFERKEQEDKNDSNTGS